MNVRKTFPQEWRFKTVAEWKASNVDETGVVGDFVYIEELRQILLCSYRDGHFKSWIAISSYDTPFKFDLRRPLSVEPHTSTNRPHSFNGAYFLGLSRHWPKFTFEITVAAHDLGLVEYFERADFPWRQWDDFDFLFKDGVLLKAWVDFAPKAGRGGQWKRPEIKLHNRSCPPSIIIDRFKQQYEAWREYKRTRIVQWTDDGSPQSKLFAGSGVLITDSPGLGSIEETGYGCYRFLHLSSRTQSIHDLIKKRITALGLPIIINESLPFGIKASFDPNVVKGFVFKRDRQPYKERAWHEQILELTLALAPLALPAYVLLWLFEWAHEDTTALTELARIRLIQGVYNCRTRLFDERQRQEEK